MVRLTKLRAFKIPKRILGKEKLQQAQQANDTNVKKENGDYYVNEAGHNRVYTVAEDQHGTKKDLGFQSPHALAETTTFILMKSNQLMGMKVGTQGQHRCVVKPSWIRLMAWKSLQIEFENTSTRRSFII